MSIISVVTHLVQQTQQELYAFNNKIISVKVMCYCYNFFFHAISLVHLFLYFYET